MFWDRGESGTYYMIPHSRRLQIWPPGKVWGGITECAGWRVVVIDGGYKIIAGPFDTLRDAQAAALLFI